MPISSGLIDYQKIYKETIENDFLNSMIYSIALEFKINPLEIEKTWRISKIIEAYSFLKVTEQKKRKEQAINPKSKSKFRKR
ncbi:Uncharacterised protein [Sebaldella termitidis]|uniref:Uncharacterized protein n=2 Tax=Sebaldella TaxID=32068 RepID=D1AN67_SEBTE|nr:hypothetical protein Sterm_2827 [Sebaldella termitidis ATCC 33386]SUI25003.1 Uncharacterised protein [Sebaldella termitidis]